MKSNAVARLVRDNNLPLPRNIVVGVSSGSPFVSKRNLDSTPVQVQGLKIFNPYREFNDNLHWPKFENLKPMHVVKFATSLPL